jgi:hypothetical protein
LASNSPILIGVDSDFIRFRIDLDAYIAGNLALADLRQSMLQLCKKAQLVGGEFLKLCRAVESEIDMYSKGLIPQSELRARISVHREPPSWEVAGANSKPPAAIGDTAEDIATAIQRMFVQFVKAPQLAKREILKQVAETITVKDGVATFTMRGGLPTGAPVVGDVAGYNAGKSGKREKWERARR